MNRITQNSKNTNYLPHDLKTKENTVKNIEIVEI